MPNLDISAPPSPEAPTPVLNATQRQGLPDNWRWNTRYLSQGRLIAELVNPAQNSSTFERVIEDVLKFAHWFAALPVGFAAIPRTTTTYSYVPNVGENQHFAALCYCRGWSSIAVMDVNTAFPQSSMLVSGQPLPELECRSCGNDYRNNVSMCDNCALNLCCDNCGNTGLPVRLEHTDDFYHLSGNQERACVACSHPCVSCQEPTIRRWEYCPECVDFRGYCIGCEIAITDHTPGVSYDEWMEGYHCSNCVPFICVNCERTTFHPAVSSEYNEVICESCYEEQGSRGYASTPGLEVQERFDDDAELGDDEFVVPSLENRPVRLCGLEIEGGGNYTALTRALYGKGHLRSNYISRYHAASREGGLTDYWSLEEDGSVDWELVSPIIDLDNTAHLASLTSVLRAVRADIKEGNTFLDYRCGLHIHVAATHVTPAQAFNLSTLFAYIEDVMFRLGAANWTSHRAIAGNTGYCEPIDKTSKNARQFGMTVECNDNRYGALSFRNYFNAMLNNCRCGAVRYDSWDNCECTLQKCTFEFRLFNSSANMKKIHAYLALCQALVAKATTLAPISDRDESYPVLAFEQRAFDTMSHDQQETLVDAWKVRLLWMLTELPLTETERSNVIYCIQNSELAAVGVDFINMLAGEPATLELQEVRA